MNERMVTQESWAQRESRVERSTGSPLEIFDAASVTAKFCVSGATTVACREPRAGRPR